MSASMARLLPPSQMPMIANAEYSTANMANSDW